MIREVAGNLLDDDADALVNPVNTVGVMGAGLALQFQRAYPNMYRDYRAACRDHLLVVGTVHLWPFAFEGRARYIINFPTKHHWRAPSRRSYIEDGLVDLVRLVQYLHIETIAVPALGCGRGGLAWSEVRELVPAAFEALPDVDVRFYVPWIGD